MEFQSSSHKSSFSVINLLNSEYSFKQKVTVVLSAIQYYLKLKIGELTRQIYLVGEQNTVDISSTSSYFDTRKLDVTIRNFIKKNSALLPNIIDPSKNLGFEHIGFGAFFKNILNNPMLLTQGKASFYFFTPKKKDTVFSITLHSIAKISGTVTFENKKIIDFKLPSLTQYTYVFQINKDDLIDTVSKITVSTREFWSPHYLDENIYDIPVGVGVKKITIDHTNDSHNDSNV